MSPAGSIPTAWPPLTEEQRKILASREARYIEACKTGQFVRDDFGHVDFDHNHPEVKAAEERMLKAAGLRVRREVT